MPHGPSGRVVLDAYGSASLGNIAQARLNELGVGSYKVCYATAASGADTNVDFGELGTVMSIFVSLRHPTLDAPVSVGLGHDMVIRWKANQGLDGRVSHRLDWIGLYRHGACMASDRHWRHGGEKILSDSERHLDQNACYLQARRLPAGLPEGEVRFSFADYGTAGDYDVRFFEGDSRNSSGVVCRGDSRVEGRALVCSLEAAVVSSAIVVENHFAEQNVMYYAGEINKPQIPGMEMFCKGAGDCVRLAAKQHLDSHHNV
jgi:hypothetical protein